MIKFTKLLTLLAFFFLKAEGKLDIKCIRGRSQAINISDYQFGNIYSPGYTEGKPYPNEMACVVTLTAQIGKYIRLTFNYIDIALNPACGEDFVSVAHFNTPIPYEVGRYCGNIRVPDYVSTGNEVTIQFQSSYLGTGIGFNITYREVSSPDLCKAGEIECRNRKCILEENNLCNGKDDCGDGTDEEDCDYPIQTPEKCGIPDVQPVTEKYLTDRIVGGREAARGSWPWQVDMQLESILVNGHFCGGTLLNPQWFITAAHCIEPVPQPFLARVHLGNHHKYKEDPYEKVRYVKEFFIYGVKTEDFMEDLKFNMIHDLALVKMNAPIELNPHIQVACLPQLNEELKVGEKCFATGWGDTRGSKSDDVLKQAQHPIQSGAKCLNDFQAFVNETMICAGRLDPLHGLCHGDSGGPLVCKKDGKWHVYGVASFITDTNFIHGLCGVKNRPTVFNKLSRKIDWIKSTISQNS